MSSALSTRIKTAIAFGIPVLFLVFFNDLTRVIFLSIITIWAAIEFNRLHYKDNNKWLFISPSVLITCLCLFFGLKAEPQILQYGFYISLVFNLVLIFDLILLRQNLLSKIPWLTSILYTTLPLTMMIFLRQNIPFKELLIGSLIIIWLSDSGAYFTGKRFGKNKLMPSISPGKTWEGFFGAGLFSLIGAIAFTVIFPEIKFQEWIFIAISVWIFGSLGDLVESMMKRHLNIKDSGTVLPGHGGILDRFDGFYFCLPFVIFILVFLRNII